MIFEDGELLPNTVIYGIGFGRLEVSPSTAEVKNLTGNFDNSGPRKPHSLSLSRTFQRENTF